MINIHKCFYILEKLNQTKTDGSSIISSKVNILKKHLQDEFDEIHKLAMPEITSPDSTNTDNEEWFYSYDEMLSEENIETFSKISNEASKYGIRNNLLTEMYAHPILKSSEYISTCCNYNRLKIALQFVDKIYDKPGLVNEMTLDTITLDFMAAAICLLSTEIVNENGQRIASSVLNCCWNNSSKVKYFKNLLMLKSIKKMPTSIQKIIHKDLLEKLQNTNGFIILLGAMLPQMQLNAPNWQLYEVISNIVAHKGHTKEFYLNLISQIFSFITTCIGNRKSKALIPAGVLSLRKMYLLKLELKEAICKEIEQIFKDLIKPKDVIAGMIVMENNEISLFVNMLSFIFCGTSMQSLASEILIEYLPLLISLHAKLPGNSPFREQVNTIIVQCLANREKTELTIVLENLVLGEKYHKLHPRIIISYNDKLESVTAQICPIDSIENIDILNGLTAVLINSNNNILIYNAFMSILYLLDKNSAPACEENIDLLCDDLDLEEFLIRKYNMRFSIIVGLKDLIAFKPFHSQFNENPTEFVEFLKSFLEKRSHSNLITEDDNSLPLILEIFQAIIECSNIDLKKLVNLKKMFATQSENIEINRQIDQLIDTIENKSGSHVVKDEYTVARRLIEESQSHLKVYGMDLMTKLIKRKDDTAIANKYAILAMALQTLREEESFTFLNCIRLFTQMTDILQVEVFEILSDEYMNDKESVDYRLKVGEAILKVTENLGKYAYKYKDILINCFLIGSKSGPEEFRCSSLSNLATVCRLMTYQVHQFFYELVELVVNIMDTEKYLPVKRAAIFVITQLLAGIDDLIQFQEYLLPIYRILKFTWENEGDEVMRTHSSNGLKSLNEKCLNFLFPEKGIEHEIQITSPNHTIKFN